MEDITARGAISVTPSDTAMLTSCRALYIGGAGDVTLRAKDSSVDAVFTAVPAGTVLPVQARFVRATGTTATAIVSLV